MTDTRNVKAEDNAPETGGHNIPFSEALWVWMRVAALSFGGPAGQIAVMHRIPACAELLHAPAGTRGAAARDIYRLVAAQDKRGARCRHSVRAARIPFNYGAQLYLCALWQHQRS